MDLMRLCHKEICVLNYRKKERPLIMDVLFDVKIAGFLLILGESVLPII